MLPAGAPRARLIQFVADRPGHDLRYAMDIRKIQRELGWSPRQAFSSGLRATVQWYLANTERVRQVTTAEYRTWIEKNYGRQITIEAASS